MTLIKMICTNLTNFTHNLSPIEKLQLPKEHIYQMDKTLNNTQTHSFIHSPITNTHNI